MIKKGQKKYTLAVLCQQQKGYPYKARPMNLNVSSIKHYLHLLF